MLAILKRELKVYYTSLFAYIYYALFFAVTGIFFSVSCLDTGSTEFGYYVIGYVFYVMVLVLPFCTMKLFAMERKHKTDQLLFTAPVSSFSVLAAKYLATVIYALLPLVLSGIYVLVISDYGTISVPYVLGSYLGCGLVVLVLLSIGMFISTLTTNVVLAVVISYVIYALTLLARVVEAIVPAEGIRSLVHEISVYNIFNDMISGVVFSDDVFYLISLSVLFFLLTWFVLESRRQSLKKMLVCVAVVVLIFGVVNSIAFFHSRVYDLTPEKILTLSEQTEEVVSQLDKETDIYYIGEQSRANVTYREFLNRYDALSDKLHIHYKNVATDAEFQLQYLSQVSNINESSLLVVCEDRFIYLDSAEYVEVEQLSQYFTEETLQIEAQLTSAIHYVNQDESTEIAVVSGHAEESLNGEFSNILALNGYDLEEVNLPEAMLSLHSAFSSDCKAVLLNAPQSDLSEDEITELENYLEKGGNLFVVLDPLNEDTTNLYSFLKKYGLDVCQGIVIERQEGMYTEDTPYYLVPKMEDNAYTKEMIDDNLCIYAMTSKGILPGGSGNGYESTDVLLTSGKAFAKLDDYENIDTKGEGDIGGPFSVASCATNPNAGRIFLVATNVLFHEEADALSDGANRKFFVEIMKQLTDEETIVWMEGKTIGSQVALYPYNSRNLVKAITIVVIPVFILLAGILVVVVRNFNVVLFRTKKKDDKEEEQNDEENSET